MKIIFLTIYILFIQANSHIKNNPIELLTSISKPLAPIVLSSTDNYYYIITSGIDLKIDKDSGDIINKTINNIISSNYIYHVDNSNNNYIYNSIYYYKITFFFKLN